MKRCFHSHFYAIYHASVTLVFFLGLSRNIHLNVELRNWEMIYTILESFCSIFNWEGAYIRPQIKPRKRGNLDRLFAKKNIGMFTQL